MTTARVPASPPTPTPGLSRARWVVPGLIVLPGFIAVGVFVLWGVHDGGYDNDTWYWGALLTLAMLTGTVLARRRAIQVARPAALALAALTLYVAWSYLSITWASAKGLALQGSHRALLYLLLYALMLVLPWRRRTVQAALGIWILGIGVLAVALLFRFAEQDKIAALLFGGRLAAPTGYNNGTAALFFMGALSTVAIAIPRGLPGPVRGLALALACAELQLVLIVQSRGWLFTLPITAVLAAAGRPDRLRAIPFIALPVLGVGLILHRLLAVYDASAAHVSATVAHAGRAGLLVCFGVFVARHVAGLGRLAAARSGTVTAPAPRGRRAGGAGLVAGVGGAAGVATHGHPVRFVVRQWDGFSRLEQTTAPGTSHFVNIGSGRYDFWRVALDAFVSHPIGGLGQDNFETYYIARGRSGEDPSWTHSLEMRLLAHTGVVGFAAVRGVPRRGARGRAAGPTRRRRCRRGRVVAAAMMPLIVWTVHGSVDWFWEMPALSGPALGFLALAGALARPEPRGAAPLPSRAAQRARIALRSGAGALRRSPCSPPPSPSACPTSRRRASIASDLAASNPRAALAELRSAADLDPLNADVTRSAGTIALQIGDAARRRPLRANAPPQTR